MHSPLLYMTQNKDFVLDLNKPEEKERFMDELYPHNLEMDLDSYIPYSDWWEINTTDTEDWHRGQFNVKSMLEATFTDALGYEKALEEVVPGVYKVTITPDDATKHFDGIKQSIAKTIRDFETDDTTSLRERVHQLDMLQFNILRAGQNSTHCINLSEEGHDVQSLDKLYHDVAVTGTSQTYYFYDTIQGDYHY